MEIVILIVENVQISIFKSNKDNKDNSEDSKQF